MNREMKAKIEKIEDDYGFTFPELLKDLSTKEDYIGCVCNREHSAKFFGFTLVAFNKICKFYDIKFKKTRANPTHYEDVCWVKYGISIKAYLKSRYRWMKLQEMAEDLDVGIATIKDLLRKYKLRKMGVYL